jgi:hypothetical protein
LFTLGPNIAAWQFPGHECEPLRTARELQERLKREVEEAKERGRLEMLRNPAPERIAGIIELCNLPAWTPAGLGKVVVHGGCAWMEALRLANHHLRQWTRFQRPARGLWLWGPTNSRKTCVLAALCFDVTHWTDNAGLFWRWGAVMAEIRSAAQGLPSKWDASRAHAADLLVLDDIGTGKVTEAGWDRMFDLVCSAYDGAQVLYVTSNEGPDEVMDLLSRGVERETGRKSAGERVVRRLVQRCEVVRVG